MLEKLVSELLTSYLGEYFENVDMEQVKISLWRGQVHLQQLRVRKDALRFFDVPFCIADGVIEELVVTIPWTHLNSESVVLAMRRVRLVVQPRRTAGYSAAQVYKESMQRKTRQLEAFDEVLFEEWANKMRAASNEAASADSAKESGDNKKDSTFVARLQAAVVHNIKVTMEDVRLEYVCSLASPIAPTTTQEAQAPSEAHEADERTPHDAASSGAERLGLSLHIHYLSTYACDEAYEPAFAAVKSRLMHKQLRLNGVSIRLLTGVAGKDTTMSTAYEVVRPFNALALLQHQPVLFQPRVPRYLLGIRLEDFIVQLDEHQWGCLLLIAHDVWQAKALDFDVRERPRHAGPRQDPRAWWRYACRVIVQRLRRRPGRRPHVAFSWALYREVKQLRMEYTRLYMRARRAVLQASRWLDALSPDEAKRLYTLEEELPVEVIQMARRMALQRVQQERAEYLRIVQERRQKQQQEAAAAAAGVSPRSMTPGMTTSSSLEESSSTDTAASPHAQQQQQHTGQQSAAAPAATAGNWLLRWWERRGSTGARATRSDEGAGGPAASAEERTEIQHMIDLMTAPRWTEAERIAMAQEFGCTTEEANELLMSSGTSAASSPAANATPRQTGGGDGSRVVRVKAIIELAHVAAQLHSRGTPHRAAASEGSEEEAAAAAALVGVYMQGVTLGLEQVEGGALEAWAAIAVYGADTCTAAGRRCASILHAYRESDLAGGESDEVVRRLRSEEYAAIQGGSGVRGDANDETAHAAAAAHDVTTPTQRAATPVQPALSPLQSVSVERSPSVAADHAVTVSKQIKNALVHRMRIPFASCATIVRTTAAVFATYSAQLGCAGQGGQYGNSEPQRVALFCAALDVQVDAQLTRHLTSFVLLPLTRLARSMHDADPLLRPLTKADATSGAAMPEPTMHGGTTLLTTSLSEVQSTSGEGTDGATTTAGSALEPFALWSIPANEVREVQDAQLRLRALLHHVEHAWALDWRCELEMVTLYIANPARTHASRVRLRTVRVQNDMEQQRRRARRAATPHSAASPNDKDNNNSSTNEGNAVAFQPAAFGEEEGDWVSTVAVTVGESSLACALMASHDDKDSNKNRKADTSAGDEPQQQPPPITSDAEERPWQKAAWRALLERLPLRLTLKLNLLGRRHPHYPALALQLQSPRLLTMSVSRTRLAVLQHSVGLVTNLAQEVSREWRACYAVLRPERHDAPASLGWFELAVLQQDTAFFDDADETHDAQPTAEAFASWPHCMMEVRPGCVVLYHVDRSAYPKYYLELRRDHFHVRPRGNCVDVYVENGGPPQTAGARRHYRDALRLVRTTTQLPLALADNATLLRAHVEAWLHSAAPPVLSAELQSQLSEAVAVLEAAAAAVPCHHVRLAVRDAQEVARLTEALRRSGAMSTQAVLALDEATLQARAAAVPQVLREQKLASVTVDIPALQLKLVEEEEGKDEEEEEEGNAARRRVDVHEFACTPFHLVYDQHRERHVIALQTNECALHAFPEQRRQMMRVANSRQEREAVSARSQKAVMRVSPVTVVARHADAQASNDDAAPAATVAAKDSAASVSLRVTITPRPRPLALLSHIQLAVQPSALLQLRLNMALARAVEALWDCFGVLIGRQYFPVIAACSPWRAESETAEAKERMWREDTSGGAMLQNVAELHVDRLYAELFCPLADKGIARQDDASSPTIATSHNANSNNNNNSSSNRSSGTSTMEVSHAASATEHTTATTTTTTATTAATTTVVEPTPALTLAGRQLALVWQDWVGRGTVRLALRQPKIELQPSPSLASPFASPEDALVTFVAPVPSKEGNAAAEVSLELERPPPMLSMSDYLRSSSSSSSSSSSPATGFRVAQRLGMEATHVQMLYRHREFMSLLNLITCDMLKRLLALTQRPPFQLTITSSRRSNNTSDVSNSDVAVTPLMPASPATLLTEESSAGTNTVSWGWMEKHIAVREARVWLPETGGVPAPRKEDAGEDEEEEVVVTTTSSTLRYGAAEAPARTEPSSLPPVLTANIAELVVQDVLQPRFAPARLQSGAHEENAALVVREVGLETQVRITGADVRHTTSAAPARAPMPPVFMRELGLRLGIAQTLFASPTTPPGKTFRIALGDVVVHGNASTLELLLNMFYKNYLEPASGDVNALPSSPVAASAQGGEDSRWYIDVPYACIHLQCPAVTLRQDAAQAIVRSRIDNAVVAHALHVELNWQRGRLAAIAFAVGCASAWELGHLAATLPWTRHPSEVAHAGAAFVQLFSPTHHCLRESATTGEDAHDGVRDPALTVQLRWGGARGEQQGDDEAAAAATRQSEVRLRGVVFTVLPRALFDLRDSFLSLGVYNAVARMLRWPLYDSNEGTPVASVAMPASASAEPLMSTTHSLRIERLSVNLPGMKSNVLVPLACIAVEGVAGALEQDGRGGRSVRLAVQALSRNGIFYTTGHATRSGLVEADALATLPLRPLLLQPSPSASPTSAGQPPQQQEDLLEELFAEPTALNASQSQSQAQAPPAAAAAAQPPTSREAATPWLQLQYSSDGDNAGLHGEVSPVWFVTPQAGHLARLQRAWAQGGYRHLRWLPSFAEARNRVAQGVAAQPVREIAANMAAAAAPRGWQAMPIELTLHTPCIVIHEEDTSAKEARHLVKGLLLEMGDVTLRNVVVVVNGDQAAATHGDAMKADTGAGDSVAVYSAMTLPAITLREMAHRDRVILQPVALELRREWESETRAWRSAVTMGPLRLWLTLVQYATLLHSLFNTSFFYHLGSLGNNNNISNGAAAWEESMADGVQEDSRVSGAASADQSTSIATLHYLFGAEGVGLGMEAPADMAPAAALREAGDTMARQQTQLRLAGLDVRVRGEATRVRFAIGAVELNTMTTTTTTTNAGGRTEAATRGTPPSSSSGAAAGGGNGSNAVNRIRLTVAGDVVLGVEDSRALIALRGDSHGGNTTTTTRNTTAAGSSSAPPLSATAATVAVPVARSEDLCVDLSLTRQDGVEEGLAQLGTLSLYLEPHATAAVLALLYLPYAKAIHTAHGDDKVLTLVQNTTLSDHLHLSAHNQLHARATQYNCLTLDAAGHEVHLHGSRNEEDDAPIVLDEGLTLYLTHARLFLHGRPLEAHVKAGPGSYVVADATMNEVIFAEPGRAAVCGAAAPLGPDTARAPTASAAASSSFVAARGEVAMRRGSSNSSAATASETLRPRLHRLFNVSGRLRVVLPQMPLPSAAGANDRGRSLVLDAMATVQLVERDEAKGGAARDHLRAVSIDLDEFRVRNDYSLGEGVVVESSDLVSQLAIKALYTVITHGDDTIGGEEDSDDGRARAEKELEVNVLTDVVVQLRYSDVYMCVAAALQARAALMHAVGTLEVNAFTRLFSRYSQRVMSLETAASESSTDSDYAPAATPHNNDNNNVSVLPTAAARPAAMNSTTATVTIGRVDVYLLNDSAQVDLPLFHLQLQKFRTHVEKQGSGLADRCSAILHVSSALNHYDLFNSSWLGLMDEAALQVTYERATRGQGRPGTSAAAPSAVRDVSSTSASQDSVLFYGVDMELPQVKFYVSPMLVRNIAALRTLHRRFMEEEWLPATRKGATASIASAALSLRAPWEQAAFQANLLLQQAGLELHIAFAQDDASRFPAPRTLRYGDSFAFNFPRIQGRELSAGQRSVLVSLQEQVVAVNLAACGKARVPLGPGELLRRHVLIDISVCEGQRRAELRTNVSVVNRLRVPIALDAQGNLVAPNDTYRIRLEHLRRRVVFAPQRVGGATPGESCALGVCYAELPELSGQTFLCVSRTPSASMAGAVQSALMYFFCTVATQSVAPSDVHSATERGSFALNTSVADTTATLVAPLTLSNQLGLPVNVVLVSPRLGGAARSGAYERLAEFNVNAGERYGITQADPLQPIYVELTLSQPNGGVLTRSGTGGLACIYNPREPARRQADIVLEDATTRARLVLCFQYRQRSEVVLWCPFWIISKVPYRLQIAEDTGLQRSAANRGSRGGGVTLVAGMSAADGGEAAATALEATQGKPFLFHTHTAQEKGWRYNLYIRMQLGARERGAGRWSRWAGPIPLLEITGQPRAVQCAFGQDSLLGMLSFTVEVARGQAGGGAIRVLTFYPHCTIVNRTRHPMQACQTLRGGAGQGWVNDVDYIVPVAAEHIEAIALGRGDESAASVAPPPSSSGDDSEGGGALMPHFIRLRREPDAALGQSSDRAPRTHWSRPISTTERGDQYVNLQYVQLIKMEDYWPSQATLDLEDQENNNSSSSSNTSGGGGLAPQLPPLTPEMIVEQDKQLYVKVIRSAVCHVTCYWHNHVRCVEVTQPAQPPYMIENRTDCTLYVAQRMPGGTSTPSSSNSFVAVHARTSKGYAFETTTAPPCLVLIAKSSERDKSRPCELDLSATALAEQSEAVQRTIVFADMSSGTTQRVLYVRLRSGPGWSRIVSVTAEPAPRSLPAPQAAATITGATTRASARGVSALPLAARPRRRAPAVEWQVALRVRGVYTLLTEGVGADYVLCTIRDFELVVAQGASREVTGSAVQQQQQQQAARRRYLQRFVCSMQNIQLDDERVGTKKVVVLQLQSRSFYTSWTRQLLRHAPVLYFRDVVIALGAIEAHLEDSFLYDMVDFYHTLLEPWRQASAAASSSPTNTNHTSTAAASSAAMVVMVQNASPPPSAALASATDGTSWTLREVVIQDLRLERVALTLSLYHSPGEQYDLMWQKLSSLSFLIRSAKEVPLVWPRIRAREVCMPVWKLWDSYLEQYQHRLYSQVFSAVYSVAGDAVLGFFSNILAITGLTEGSGGGSEQARAALQHERRREAHFRRDAQELDTQQQQQQQQGGGAISSSGHTRSHANSGSNSSGTSVSHSAVAVSIVGTSERQGGVSSLTDTASHGQSGTRPGSYATSSMTVSGPPRMFAVNNKHMSLQQMAATVSWSNFLSVVTASELRQYGAVAVRGALRASPAMPLISPRTAPPTMTAVQLIATGARSGAAQSAAPHCTRCAAVEAMRVARLQQNAPTALPHPDERTSTDASSSTIAASSSSSSSPITWAELAHHVSWQEFVELATNDEVARYAALVVNSLIGRPHNVILWQP